MKFCEKHWNQMKDAVRIRGMWHLVAKDGETALNSIVGTLQGTADKSDFDPLMNANWAIQARIMQIRGLMYMAPDAPYGGCPMCEPDVFNPGWADNWINGCMDEIEDWAREQGIIPRRS